MDLQKMRQQAKILRNKRQVNRLNTNIKAGVVKTINGQVQAQSQSQPQPDKAEANRKKQMKILEQRKQLLKNKKPNKGCSACSRKTNKK